MSSEKLKPCPCCGNAARGESGVEEKDPCGIGENNQTHGFAWVACTRCNLTQAPYSRDNEELGDGEEKARAASIAAWNRRPSLGTCGECGRWQLDSPEREWGWCEHPVARTSAECPIPTFGCIYFEPASKEEEDG